MNLKLFNPLTSKQLKKTASDSVWEKARKNLNKVQCSCLGDRKGLETSPCLDHGQVLSVQPGSPSAAGYRRWQLWAGHCRNPCSPPLGEEGLERKKEEKRDEEKCLSCLTDKTPEIKMARLARFVYPKCEFACRLLILLSWFLVLLCLKAKEVFAERNVEWNTATTTAS